VCLNSGLVSDKMAAMRRTARCFSITLLATSFCCPAYSQCVASPEIKVFTDAFTAAGTGGAPQAERKAAQKKVLDEALTAYPTDVFLLDRKRDWFNDNTSAGREAAILYFAALHEKYPDSPAVTAEYADVLRAKDSSQAVKLLEASETAHPKDSWTHYKLLPVYESGKFRNQHRLVEELDAYLKLCPSPSSSYAYRIMTTEGAPEQIAHHASLLRARLEAELGAPNQGLWTALWDLEFKAAPPTDHPAVRERIGKDLGRFESFSDHDEVAWLTFLLKGYQLMGDRDGADRIAERIVETSPNSREAETIVTEGWQKEHPFPRESDHSSQQAWFRSSAAVAHQWYERWHGMLQLMQEFTSRAALDDTTPEELVSLGRKYIQSYHENPNSFYGANPVEFEVADALIRKNALPAEIPAWLDEGYFRENNRPSRMLGRVRDEMTEEMKARADRQTGYMRIERARILLDYYDALGQPTKAPGIEDQLSGVTPAEERLKPELYEVRAHAALMDKRKLDALMYYRAARDLGGKQTGSGKTDTADLDQKIDLLYKELGGTQATFGLLTGKAMLSPLSSMTWETPKNPLPSFNLTDLSGKSWKLADVYGSAILINIWATWCGPCREEHAAFERLYEMLKDSKDITVLSVNVDAESGLVAPYMTEHKYTFPVVFGKELVDAVEGNEVFGIPQNWFVSPAGKLEAIQLGYGGDPNWQSIILARLQEVMKAK
jgi:thiol-disulfide isomerase/thioredoxin